MRDLPRLLATLVGLVSYFVHERALDPVTAAQEDQVLRLAVVSGWLLALWIAWLLRSAVLDEPRLDALLTLPLTETQLFWKPWRRYLRRYLAIGCGLAGLPAWSWLFARDADAWLYPASIALIAAGLAFFAAAGTFLAPLGALAPGLVFVPIVLLARSDRMLEELVGGLARPWQVETLHSVTGAHPMLAAVAGLALGTCVLLVATHVALRWTYSRGRVLAYRERLHR